MKIEILLLVAVTLVALIVGHQVKGNWMDEIVAHGCAEYDKSTGEWGWLPVTREAE